MPIMRSFPVRVTATDISPTSVMQVDTKKIQKYRKRRLPYAQFYLMLIRYKIRYKRRDSC